MTRAELIQQCEREISACREGLKESAYALIGLVDWERELAILENEQE